MLCGNRHITNNKKAMGGEIDTMSCLRFMVSET
ncbi:hypothetical protein ES703_81222 [subsurface metagenome]